MVYTLILAGGAGSRMGITDIPKQYLDVVGKPVVAYCLEIFQMHSGIDKILIAADEMLHSFLLEQIDSCSIAKFCGFTSPGKTRQYTILNGLNAMKSSVEANDIVIIHDAARPLVSEQIITDCLDLFPDYDGAMPVLKMKDTVYLSIDGESINSLLDRNQIFAGQSPESFRFGKYLSANLSMPEDKFLKINGSSEPAVLSKMKVKLVEGSERNFKITTQADLKRFRVICETEGSR